MDGACKLVTMAVAVGAAVWVRDADALDVNETRAGGDADTVAG